MIGLQLQPMKLKQRERVEGLVVDSDLDKQMCVGESIIAIAR